MESNGFLKQCLKACNTARNIDGNHQSPQNQCSIVALVCLYPSGLCKGMLTKSGMELEERIVMGQPLKLWTFSI